MRPFILVVAPNVMAVPTRTEPSKSVVAPTVKVVPVTHKTFSALAPLVRMILQPAPTSMVVVAWKINLDSGSPSPSKVTVVPSTILMVAERQVPGSKVKPPICTAKVLSLTLSIA
jgi:hypothetical protein